MNAKAIAVTAAIAAGVFILFALASNFGFDVRSILPAPSPGMGAAGTPEGNA